MGWSIGFWSLSAQQEELLAYFSINPDSYQPVLFDAVDFAASLEMMGKKPKDTSQYTNFQKLSFKEKNSGAFRRRKKGGNKDPLMAGVCSAVVPGLGQIYNGQWYKTPVVYGAAAVVWYFADDNLRQRKVFDKEIKARTEGNEADQDPKLARYSFDNIVEVRNSYQHNFELTMIIAAVCYALNIIDAVVYAHLSYFDVNKDLTWNIQPYVHSNNLVFSSIPVDMGLKFSMKF